MRALLRALELEPDSPIPKIAETIDYSPRHVSNALAAAMRCGVVSRRRHLPDRFFSYSVDRNRAADYGWL